jgi:hypothetical protein
MIDSVNKENVENPWFQAVSYAKRNGGIIPGKAISFKSKPNGYVIKAHWGRWVFILVLFAVAIIHFLPTVLPFIIPLEKEYPIEKTLFFALFGFFLLYLTYQLFIPLGKIIFDKESENIHIIYGTLIHRHKIIIPHKDISLKTYMFKADKPDIRIRYGNTILSLINQNEFDSELILAAIKNEKKMQAVLDKLSCDLNITILSGVSSKSDMIFSSGFMDLPKDKWQKLVENSQSQKPFFDNSISNSEKLTIQNSPERTLIKKRKRWFLGVFILAFALFLIILTIIISIKEQEFNLFVTIMMCGLSLFFLFPAYQILASVNSILLIHWNNSLCLRYGFYPFTKEIIFPKDKFEACLYKCDIEAANKVKKPGQIVLSLIFRDTNKAELVLSTSDIETNVTSAFKALESFIGKSSEKELNEEISLSNGEYVNVPKTSLSGRNIDGKKRKYCVIDENVVAFKANWFLAGMFTFAVIMGLFIAFCFLNDEPDKELFQRIFGMVLVSIICGFMILSGISFGLYSLFTRCLVADKESDTLSYSPFVHRISMGKIIMKLSEIEAIQLCSVFTFVRSGNSQRGTNIYEINVITNKEENRRINITCGEKYDRIRPDATAFAEFLSVPLFDHTIIQ